MKERAIFTDLKEVIAPEQTALVVWDVQNMLVNRIFNKEAFMTALEKTISAARKSDIPIFFTKITPLPLRFESSPRLSNRRNSPSIPREQYDLYVKPQEGDVIINKNTPSIFVGTNFELMVRNAEIRTIVFTGIATEMGIETSARSSMSLGFHTVVVEDAVSSGDREAHDRSLLNLKKLVRVESSASIMEAWR